MKIAVVFGSHRSLGKSKEIEEMLIGLPSLHEYDFIRMSEIDIQSCSVCNGCEKIKRCVMNDEFNNILHRLIKAEIIMIITPVYTPIPSRLAALFEKLLSISFLNTEKPLKGKKTAIVYYCSTKICDETEIKMLFQKYLMDDYGFVKVDYNYINNESNPNEKYNNNVVEYVKDIVMNL